LYPQLFGIELSPDDKNSGALFLFAEYTKVLDEWIDRNFSSLRTIENWKQFYGYLVYAVCTEAGIDSNFIAVPDCTDTIQMCRLLFQSLVNIRMAFADGQHRVCAMMKLLAGFSIKVQTMSVPPKTFNYYDPYKKGALGPEESLNKILPTMTTRGNLRIISSQTTTELESWCVKYSQVREQSQAKHKPRVLIDV
jgi:hypothetical protein